MCKMVEMAQLVFNVQILIVVINLVVGQIKVDELWEYCKILDFWGPHSYGVGASLISQWTDMYLSIFLSDPDTQF